MNQNINFTVDQLNQMLAYCDNLPYRFAKPLIDQIQQIAGPQLQEIQTNGATNPQVQATINETEAKQD